MTFSRYFGVPLLAALSLGVSLALLPMKPNGLSSEGLDLRGGLPISENSAG